MNPNYGRGILIFVNEDKNYCIEQNPNELQDVVICDIAKDRKFIRSAVNYRSPKLDERKKNMPFRRIGTIKPGAALKKERQRRKCQIGSEKEGRNILEFVSFKVSIRTSSFLRRA